MRIARYNDFDPLFFRGIAHRGLHDSLISENSLEAFSKAIEEGYCFECDVHLSRDGRLFVFHDHDLARMTGEKGLIEDLDGEALSKFRLTHGEKIPTFEELLELNKDYKVPMVVEIKATSKNYRQVARALKKALKEHQVPYKKVVVISFDPRALLFFGSKGYVRQLLVEKHHVQFLKLVPLFGSLDIEKCLLNQKSVQKFRKRGGIVNSWTYESLEEVEENKALSDAFSFQYFDIRALL